jgi:capsule biosynthesis phosphatase
MSKIFVFDLDGTLCEPDLTAPETHIRYYENCKPLKAMINIVNEIHKKGHKVIIHTARRMVTHNGDVEAVKADVELITRTWLAEYKVRYDELIFGKPYGDYYIDDKGLSIGEFLEKLQFGE